MEIKEPIYKSLHSLALDLGLPKRFLKEMVDSNRIPFVGTGKHSIEPNDNINGRIFFDEQVVREILNEIAEWQRSRRAGEDKS